MSVEGRVRRILCLSDGTPDDFLDQLAPSLLREDQTPSHPVRAPHRQGEAGTDWFLAFADLTVEIIPIDLSQSRSQRVSPGVDEDAQVPAELLEGVSGALCLVSADENISDSMVEAWDALDDHGIPRAIVITDIDSPRAQTELVIDMCQDAFADLVPVLALDLPVLSDDDRPIGVIDLLTLTIIDYSSVMPVRSPADTEHLTLIRDERSWLIEATLAETDDDDLVALHLEGAVLDDQRIVEEFFATVARGRLHPILVAASTPAGLGMDIVLDVILRGFPDSLPSLP